MAIYQYADEDNKNKETFPSPFLLLSSFLGNQDTNMVSESKEQRCEPFQFP